MKPSSRNYDPRTAVERELLLRLASLLWRLRQTRTGMNSRPRVAGRSDPPAHLERRNHPLECSTAVTTDLVGRVALDFRRTLADISRK
jgi:hypothetical protein